VGGVIKGCKLTPAGLTISFDMGKRRLNVKSYNQSNVALSATSVLADGKWMPVHIATGSSEKDAKLAQKLGLL
jgi:hypothetical protein